MIYPRKVYRIAPDKTKQMLIFCMVMSEETNAATKLKLNRRSKIYGRTECYPLDGDLEGKYLTRREAECMALLVMGKSCASAARALNLSVRTVEYYVKVIRCKLNCVDKSALIEKLVSCTAFIKQLKRLGTLRHTKEAYSSSKAHLKRKERSQKI